MKKIVIAALLMSLTIFSAAGIVNAEMACPMKSKGDLSCAFMCKTQLCLSSAEELGLSEEQVANIDALSEAVQKDLDAKCQDIEKMKNSICGMLCEGSATVEQINQNIDQKYDLKKAKEKSAVAAIESLKGILTAEQNAKLKELCAKCMKDSKCWMDGKGKDSAQCPIGGKGSKACPITGKESDESKEPAKRSGKGRR